MLLLDSSLSRQVVCPFKPFRQGIDDPHRFEADGDDLFEQADDVLIVLRVIGVVGDARARVSESR